METKFFRCPHCGNLVMKIVDSGVKMICCGAEMIELQPNTSDASLEKHVPIVEHVKQEIYRIKIGSEPHPATDEHHIMFIYLETDLGGHIRYLKPTEQPVADFIIGSERPKRVFIYCNLHGLWKTEIKDDCESKCNRTMRC